MLSAKIVNSAGLVFGIVGSLLVWKFGLPSDINRHGESALLLEGTDQNQVSLAKKYDRWAKVGLICLAIGFALQLISNFL